MRKYLLTSMVFLFVSCDINDNGDFSLNGFGYLIIIGIISLFIYAIIEGNNKEKKYNEELISKNINITEFINIGKYIGGHPEINDIVESTLVRKEYDNLCLYKSELYKVPFKIDKSEIKIDDIDNITIEDKTTIENKMTVGRVFLVGIYALAWKKKKKNEIAIVDIEWHKGKFKNNTLFCFEGKDSFQKANKTRNNIIKICDE